MGLEGRVPDVTPGHMMKANQIMESVRQAQIRKLEHLKQQYDNLQEKGNAVPNNAPNAKQAQNNHQ